MAKYKLAVVDAGNANIKAKSDEREIEFPHALIEMTESDIMQLRIRGELETTPNLYCVNNVWYRVAEKAMKAGKTAALYGEARYQRSYYGVLVAIALFNLFERSQLNVFLFGSHTPKDIIYRDDLIEAAIGDWWVFSEGQEKTFRVVSANGFEEPVGAYRNATLSEDGVKISGDASLWSGKTLIVDFGGFTTAFSVAVNGKIEFESSHSHLSGILDVVDDLEMLIRRRYKNQLKGVNALDHMKLRNALTDGFYDAAGMGTLDVRDETKNAKAPLLTELSRFYEQYGGTASYNAVLLAGGGTFLLHGDVKRVLNHPVILTAESDLRQIARSTVRGGMKTLKLLESKGAIDKFMKALRSG